MGKEAINLKENGEGLEGGKGETNIIKLQSQK